MAMKTASVRWVSFGVGVVGAVSMAVLAASPSAAQTAVRVCDGVEATIVGTSGNDRLVGTEGSDVISGLQGDDQIFGLGGDDIICAGFGDDIVLGGEGFDVIFGAQGDDVLLAGNGPGIAVRQDTRGSRMFGGEGNDQLIGSNRWDRMQGGDGADLLMGYEGRDWIRGGGSADQIDGGGGIDDIHSGWGPDRIDVGFGDDIRAGLGRDHCNIDGRAERLWSCEAQVPIQQVDFDQQVDGGHLEDILQRLTPPTSIDSLGGSLWRFSSIDGELYAGGEIVFSGPGSGGTGNIRAVFSDECSAGHFSFRVREQGQLEAFGFSRNPSCDGHPTHLFRDVDGVRFPPMSATLSGDTLELVSTFGSATATHVRSSGDPNQPPPLSSMETTDFTELDVVDLARIPEATDIRLPECASSGRAGLDDDPLEDERLVTLNRLSILGPRLPYVVSMSGGSLFHNEIGLGLSVRYQPTIDWVAENTPEGHVCIDIPPPGHYGETSLALLNWEVVGAPEATATTLDVREVGQCGVLAQLIAPEITFTDTTVEIGIPFPRTPYGQAVPAICIIPQPFTVDLGEPLGERTIVPATEIIGEY